MDDLYLLLGVDRHASAAEIRRAFRRRSKEVHPDLNGGSPQAEAQFKRLNEAFQILSDPARRRQYDEQTAAATTTVEETPDATPAFNGGSGRTYQTQESFRETPARRRRAWSPYFILYGIFIAWILSLGWDLFQPDMPAPGASGRIENHEKQRFLELYQHYPDLISTREAEVITAKKYLAPGFTGILENSLRRGDTALFRKLIILQSDPEQYRQRYHEEQDQRRPDTGKKSY